MSGVRHRCKVKVVPGNRMFQSFALSVCNFRDCVTLTTFRSQQQRTVVAAATTRKTESKVTWTSGPYPTAACEPFDVHLSNPVADLFYSWTSCTMASAAARVLSIPELLENVLVNIDAIELFAVRRVNHAFAETTNNSTSLQRKMFLTSGADMPYLPEVDSKNVDIELNPLLSESSEVTHVGPVSFEYGGLGLLKRFSDFRISHVHKTSATYGRGLRGSLRFHATTLPHDPGVDVLRVYTLTCHEFQSWKSMQISSVPCQLDLEHRFYTGRSNGKMFCKYGLLGAGSTLGDLVNLLARAFPSFAQNEEYASVKERQQDRRSAARRDRERRSRTVK